MIRSLGCQGLLSTPFRAVMSLDLHGRILTANDSACLLLDLTEADLSKESFSIQNCIKEAWLPSLPEPPSKCPDVHSPDYVVIDLANKKNTQCSLVEYYVESKDVLGLPSSSVEPVKSLPHFPLDYLTSTQKPIDSEGTIFSGELVDIQTASNELVTTSLWMRALPLKGEQEGDRKFLLVLESVECTRIRLTADNAGNVVEHGDGVEELFEGHQHLIGCSLIRIIPGLLSQQVPQMMSGWCAASSPKPRLPLFYRVDGAPNDKVEVEVLGVRSCGGLVVVDNTATIRHYNTTMAQVLLGYQQHTTLLGENIRKILPRIFESLKEKIDARAEDVCHLSRSVSCCTEEQYDSSLLDSSGDEAEGETRGVNECFTGYIKELELKSEVTKSHSGTSGELNSSKSPLEAFSSSSQTNNFPSSALYGIDLMRQEAEILISQKKQSTGSLSDSKTSNASSRKDLSQLLASMKGTHVGPVMQHNGVPLMITYQVSPITVGPDLLYGIWLQLDDDSQEDSSALPSYSDDMESSRGRENNHSNLWNTDGTVSEQKDNSGTSMQVNVASHTLVADSLGYSSTESKSPMKRTKVKKDHNGLRNTHLKQEMFSSTDTSSTVPSFTLVPHEGSESFAGSETYREGQASCSISMPDSSSSSFSLDITDSSENASDEYTEGEYCVDEDGITKTKKPLMLNEDLQEQVAGVYLDHYTVLKEIGRGAFGSVRLSFRKRDSLLAVTKIIPKSCVGRGNWVTVDNDKLPLEVALLTSLDHPNIVAVLDVFENVDYVQLVMEKFGAGMDLFEFIERDPVLDDPLAAHIFRQLVSALLYLNAACILHRDVKDENIIINEHFHIKLIDFGSATYARTDGKMFSQFAGTIEYCSPEVLQGNKYLGPELEIWSVGVTLYTLMVGENPFHNVDQTINKDPIVPEHLSVGSRDLIINMLQKNPKRRYTLNQISDHEWTNQPCDPNQYLFHEVVPCTPEESKPAMYASELQDEDLQGFEEEEFPATTASASFAFQNQEEEDRAHRYSLSVGCSPLTQFQGGLIAPQEPENQYPEVVRPKSSSTLSSMSDERSRRECNTTSVISSDWSENSSSVSSTTTTTSSATSTDSDDTANECAELSTDTDDKRKNNRMKKTRRRRRQGDIIFGEHYDTGTIVRAAGKYIIRPQADAGNDEVAQIESTSKEECQENISMLGESKNDTLLQPSSSGSCDAVKRKLFLMKQGRSHGRQMVCRNGTDSGTEVDTFPFSDSNELPLEGLNSRPPFKPYTRYKDIPSKSSIYLSQRSKRSRYIKNLRGDFKYLVSDYSKDTNSVCSNWSGYPESSNDSMSEYAISIVSSTQMQSELSSANDTEHSDAQPISTSSNTSNGSSSPDSTSTDTLENSLEIVTVKRVSTPDLQCLIPEDYISAPRILLAPEDANRRNVSTLKGGNRCSSYNSLLQEENASHQIPFPAHEIPYPLQISEQSQSNDQIYANQVPTMAEDNKLNTIFNTSQNNSFPERSQVNNLFGYDSYGNKEVPSMNDSQNSYLKSDHDQYLGKFKSFSSECITEKYDDVGLVSVEHYPDIKIKPNTLAHKQGLDNIQFETTKPINSHMQDINQQGQPSGDFIYGLDNPNFQLEFYSNPNQKRWNSVNSVLNQNSIIDIATSIAFNLASANSTTADHAQASRYTNCDFNNHPTVSNKQSAPITSSSGPFSSHLPFNSHNFPNKADGNFTSYGYNSLPTQNRMNNSAMRMTIGQKGALDYQNKEVPDLIAMTKLLREISSNGSSEYRDTVPSSASRVETDSTRQYGNVFTFSKSDLKQSENSSNILNSRIFPNPKDRNSESIQFRRNSCDVSELSKKFGHLSGNHHKMAARSRNDAWEVQQGPYSFKSNTNPINSPNPIFHKEKSENNEDINTLVGKIFSADNVLHPDDVKWLYEGSANAKENAPGIPPRVSSSFHIAHSPNLRQIHTVETKKITHAYMARIDDASANITSGNSVKNIHQIFPPKPGVKSFSPRRNLYTSEPMNNIRYVSAYSMQHLPTVNSVSSPNYANTTFSFPNHNNETTKPPVKQRTSSAKSKTDHNVPLSRFQSMKNVAFGADDIHIYHPNMQLVPDKSERLVENNIQYPSNSSSTNGADMSVTPCKLHPYNQLGINYSETSAIPVTSNTESQEQAVRMSDKERTEANEKRFAASSKHISPSLRASFHYVTQPAMDQMKPLVRGTRSETSVDPPTHFLPPNSHQNVPNRATSRSSPSAIPLHYPYAIPPNFYPAYMPPHALPYVMPYPPVPLGYQVQPPPVPMRFSDPNYSPQEDNFDDNDVPPPPPPPIIKRHQQPMHNFPNEVYMMHTTQPQS